MDYIDPHIHMVSRTTDDYETLARMGCVAMSEPAFWAGFDRGSVESFRDYFRQLTDFEPKRAAQYGIKHYTWLCINAKEAALKLAEEMHARELVKYQDLIYYTIIGWFSICAFFVLLMMIGIIILFRWIDCKMASSFLSSGIGKFSFCIFKGSEFLFPK
jgi:hypothetical protein